MFAQMSLFEIIMLFCFGAAWPFSIYKSYTSRSVSGKSPYFLMIVMTGYVSGILHKLFFSYDQVIFMYVLNFLLVSTDLTLYFRNVKLQKKQAQGQ